RLHRPDERFVIEACFEARPDDLEVRREVEVARREQVVMCCMRPGRLCEVLDRRGDLAIACYKEHVSWLNGPLKSRWVLYARRASIHCSHTSARWPIHRAPGRKASSPNLSCFSQPRTARTGSRTLQLGSRELPPGPGPHLPCRAC